MARIDRKCHNPRRSGSNRHSLIVRERGDEFRPINQRDVRRTRSERQASDRRHEVYLQILVAIEIRRRHASEKLNRDVARRRGSQHRLAARLPCRDTQRRRVHAMAAVIHIQQNVRRNRLVRPNQKRLNGRGVAPVRKKWPVWTEAKRNSWKRTDTLRSRRPQFRPGPHYACRRRRRGLWVRPSHLNKLAAREKLRIFGPDVDEATPRNRNRRTLRQLSGADGDSSQFLDLAGSLP